MSHPVIRNVAFVASHALTATLGPPTLLLAICAGLFLVNGLLAMCWAFHIAFLWVPNLLCMGLFAIFGAAVGYLQLEREATPGPRRWLASLAVLAAIATPALVCVHLFWLSEFPVCW